MRKILLFLFICFFIFSPYNKVNADMGPKPSITIKLDNMETTDYLIDLLVYDEKGVEYIQEANYRGHDLTNKEINNLHNINYNNWISASTRRLIFSDCKGNNNFKHYFSYIGVPKTYKIVIINNKNGNIRVSKTFHRKELNSSIELNVTSMKTIKKIELGTTIKTVLIALIITLITEIIIAYLMRIRQIKTIIFVNLLTNITLQLLLCVTPFSYLMSFLVLEFFIIILEYMLYRKYLNAINNKKIIIYTIVANVISLSLTIFIPILKNLIIVKLIKCIKSVNENINI